MTRKQLLVAVVPAALLSPRKALGYKRDLPKFQTGDVLTAEQLNAVVRAVNER